MIATVYTAGPLGFFEAGRHYHSEILIPELRTAGFEVLDPWSMAHARFASTSADASDALADLGTTSALVGKDNADMIDRTDYVLAILDGSDVDSGTAAEIGYAAALRTPVVGIRSDIRMSGDNAAVHINLQVAYFIELSGGTIVFALEDAISELQRLSRLSTDALRESANG